MTRCLILASLLVLLGSGCAFTHVSKFGPEDPIVIPDRPYTKVGKVHAESWGPGLFYFPLWGSLDRAKRAALTRALEEGGDAVANPEGYVETHMANLMILGWAEYHFSVTLSGTNSGR